MWPALVSLSQMHWWKAKNTTLLFAKIISCMPSEQCWHEKEGGMGLRQEIIHWLVGGGWREDKEMAYDPQESLFYGFNLTTHWVIGLECCASKLKLFQDMFQFHNLLMTSNFTAFCEVKTLHRNSTVHVIDEKFIFNTPTGKCTNSCLVVIRLTDLAFLNFCPRTSLMEEVKALLCDLGDTKGLVATHHQTVPIKL